MAASCNPNDPGHCQFLTYDPKCVPKPPTDNTGDPRCAPRCLENTFDQIKDYLGAVKEVVAAKVVPKKIDLLFKDYAHGGAVCLQRTGLYCTTFETQFDSSCNRVPMNSPGTICGAARLEPRYTPLSLLWGPNARRGFEEGSVTVQFALDPSKPSAWVNWRGSDALPLLIKKGVESSPHLTGKSLFGSFTDGGKLEGTKRVPWKNGFEPLRALDRNKDKVLTGKELDNIALWFDSNRSGTADDGEIRDLRAEGVTSLSVANETMSTELGYPVIPMGYTRTSKNGARESGAIIDWESVVVPHPERALTAEHAAGPQGTQHSGNAAVALPADIIAKVA